MKRQSYVKDIQWLNNMALIDFRDGSQVEQLCNFDRFSLVKRSPDLSSGYQSLLENTSKPRLVRGCTITYD
jgi:hypothetical protein